MGNEIVKYNNDFNNQALRNFSSEELNLLVTFFHKLKEKGTDVLEYSFYELKKLIMLEKNMTVKEFTNTIMNVNKKLLSLNYTYRENNIIVQMAIFKTFKINLDEQILMISLNEDFRFLLNDFNKEWTRFELEEFVNLKSSYVKEFYRRMKQFRKTGFWRCSLDEFRYLMDIPENYKITNIDTRVLKPIMRELGEKYNLKIEKKYEFSGGRGRSRVTGFEFKFSNEKKEDIVISNEVEDNNNPFSLSKPRKSKKKEEIKIAPSRKTRIVEAPPKIEKEKKLREKIQDKIENNNMEIVRLKAMYEGLKDKIQFKKMIDQYPKKIQKIQDMNMQLEAIYEVDEENFTQEIIELAEELIKNKV